MKKNTLILLLSCLFINVITAQNLLVNGNFESGGVGVGFNINSTGYNYVATPTSSTSPGDYSFGANPLPYNTSNFISGFDHTTGLATGKMMIIDGSTDGGNPSFWKAGNSGGGVCGLTVGATYTFRYWVKTISTNVTGVSTQPDIRVVFNNATVLTSPPSFLAPLPAAGWEMRTYTFTPTNACVNIELRNFNTNPVGNDFAIDDLSLTPPASPLSITYSALNTSCPASSDGSIAIYATGGTQSYTSYSITGPVSQTNALGIFTGLPAGTYTISATDSAPTTVSQSNVVIANPVNPLVVSSNTSICSGSNTTLSVSGGSTYTWTASPADPSLTTPNSATPTVSPAATTTYTVTSSITSPRSLIVNGDFSQGNSGFGTDYQYIASAPAVGIQRAYGIVTNPSSWFTPFSTCGDHTTGTGNMMVVDGSNLNAGNDRLWSQTVPVLPGQNHTFSYWIQTVATPNPAQIEVLINGVSQGIGLAPAIATCGNWTQYSYVWNSGASNTAQIVIYDRNTNVAGNDFAIDDISFTANATCSVSKSVTITVNTLALIVPGNQIVCNGTLIPLLSFPTNLPGATVSWTNNNPLLAIGSAGQGNLTNVLATNTTSAPIVATITVTASLSGCTDVTNSFTITINPSPSVLVNSPVKCTGDTAPVLIQATPSVAGTYNYAWTVPAGVPAPGNVPSFNSAIAGNYTVVITNATTGCISQPSTGTLTYITNCCPDEITIDAPNPVLCNASSCTTISASYIDIKDTTSYTVASIPYAPLVPLGNAGTSLCNVDDAYSAVTPIPFDFSFYGSCFDSFQLSTNTYLTFTTNNANCTGGSPWAFTQAIPALFGANVEYQNSIYFPMNDTNPAVPTPAATPIDVRYIVDGVAPCRKLIVNIKNMPLFSCGTAQGLQESQLVLYESTNIIDIYVKSRTVCAGWNSGSGVIGITGQTAAEGLAAPGRNTGTWTATNEAWRFSPSGPSLTSFRWLENGNPIGTTPTISVCPSVTTTYTAEVRYTQCNLPGPPATIVRTVTEPVTIEVFPDDTLAPNTITNCIPNNIFNLTSNEPTVLGPLNGTGAYDVYYYTNQADAENAAANSILNPAAYQLTSGTSQTIYMSLISTNNPCIRVKSFNIILDDCSTCPTITNPSPTQTLCLNSDPAPFTVNTTFTGANSISYVYFTTPQVGTNMYSGGILLANVTPNAGGIATYDAPVLGSAGSLPNVLGPYYVYAIANPAPSDVTCRPFQLIQVIVNTSPNAGTDGNTTICETSTTPINLFNLITGEQAGGTWSQTGGTGGVFNAAAGTFTPAIGATTSTFNYTLTGAAPCTGDFSIATVNINPQPNAGNDGTLVICLGNLTTVDLFSIITSEQSGGSWVRTSGTGGTFNALAGTFTPSATTTNSTFTYTLLGISPCIDDSSIATINFVSQPTAGTDGSLNICGSSSTPINLFSLITGESSGGSWVRTGGTGGIFNAGTGTFTPSAGTTSSTFEYTVTGAAPCGVDISIASVNITAQLDAGIDGSLTVCETSGIIDLFSIITSEQSGGSWVRTTGTGGTFDSVNGTFTPAVGATTSTFTYTLTGIAPCISDLSVATITINAQPVAGADGGITICETSTAAITLATLITGEQIGGTWTRTLGTGGVFNAAAGTFTPALGATTSTFTYTLTGTAPCINDTSVATVTINAQPIAGVDGATTVCETLATAINLATLITGEQIGGTWVRLTGAGGAFNAAAGTFTPAVGVTTSTFEYTLLGTAPCINDTSIATVNINAQPVAGTDGGITICETSTTLITLSTLITGEQIGGTWTRTGGTGGVFNAAAGTFTPVLGATTSTFTYTLLGTAPCINDTSLATVTINPQPIAGVDGATTVCETSAVAINLATLITGEQIGGTWVRLTGTGGVFNAGAGTFTPAVGATTSTFEYTLLGTAPCINDTSIATVTINPQPIAGIDGSLTVCETSGIIDLYSIITSEQLGGSWVRTTGTGGTFDSVNGTFTPSVGSTTSTFTYTLTGIAPCISDSSVATITINAQPVAGADGGITICETSTAAITLATLITGEQIGGTWTRTSGTGGVFNAAAGTFTPALGATTSTFTYTLTGTAPCINDTSVATVTINAQPIAGVDGATTVCETLATAINLATLITGEQIGGTWVRLTGAGGAFNAAAGTFTPAVGATTSTFEYTLLGTAPCINDTSIATVNINAQPVAGTDGGITICETSTTLITLSTLITGEQIGGTWTRTTGTGGAFNAAAGTFTPAVGATTSTFEYTLLGTAPCINDTSLATVTINQQPIAGVDGATTVCETSAVAVNLATLITGEQSGGTWTRTSGTGGVFSAAAGTFTPAVGATTSTFLYTLTGTAPCINDTSIATVNINAQPVAGNDGATTVCETSTAAIDLSTLITGEQIGGTWTRTTGTGGVFNAVAGTFTPAVGSTTSTFTYTLTGIAPCINDTSIATVNINAQPIAGNDGATTVCETSTTSINLATLITGEQIGGTWTRTSGTGGVFSAAAGTFTPAVGSTTSTFLYTLTGTGPCIDDTSIATVNINAQPNAGSDGGTTICQSSTNVIDLSTLITGEQIGGTWTRTSGTGGTFNAAAATFTSAAGATTSTFTYTLTATAPCNNDTSIATVNIITAPTITTPTPYQVCDENADGISCLFFLQTKNAEITTNPNLVVTYHLTATDALTGSNIITQNPYCNITSAFSQLLHVRVVDPLAPACPSTTTLQLIVNPKPLINPNVTDYALCDNNSPGDGVEQFNLPTKTAQIINGQSNMTVRYYFTQADATSQTSPLTNLYTNVTPNAQVIWYTIRNTVTGCISVGSFSLIVNPLPVTTVNSPTVCTGDAATVTATVSTAGTYSYAWTVPSGVPNPGNVASFTTTVAGTYSVVTTNTVTGCVGLSASGIVNLIYAPIITTPSNYVVCDENNDGESCLFDLTTKNSQISTQVGIVISYHLTPTDAQTGSNPISTTTPYCNITNPQTIHVRVFDPLAPACSSFTSFQLIVTPKPVANTVSDYNLCDSNPSLTITEAVFNLTGVVTPQVLGTTLPSASHTVTYYTSLADAQVPTNAISTVAALAYTSVSRTLWIRVQNNTTGCFDITTVNLVVNPLPIISAFYPQYELCETVAPLGVETFNLNSQLTAILLGQTGMQVTFYPSLGQAQTGTGAIVNTGAYANVVPYAQTLGIRITNTATGCYSISTMDLVVNPKPQPIAPTTPYTVCDDDTDGISQFDLNTLTSGILLGAPGVYDISYHLTSVDASTPANPISLTSLFTNNQAFVQFLWVRAEDPNTGCFTVIQIELNVDPSPVMPTTLPIIANCDADSNTQDGCTTFNLTTQTPIILAAQALPGSNYTVTYYTTQANASTTPNGTLPIFNTTNYTACGTTTIWVRVQNKNTGCFQVGSFQLQVNTPIVLTTPTLLSVCDNDNLPNNNQTTFNMLGFISPSVPLGHTIAFYTSTTYTPANLISNPSAFINTTPGSQTVFIVVTNTTTGCKSYRTLTVQVLPVPTPNTNMTGLELEACDNIGPNDGSEIFDLTTNAAYIANGDPNVTLHYYTSQANAIADTNEILTPTSANVSGNVWIRVESNVFTGTNGQNCYVLVEQPVIINPVPIIKQPVADYQECDDDTDGFTLFNLNGYASELLAGNPLPITSYTLNFYTGPGATNPIASNFTNTSNPQTIFVTATNIATGCTGPVGQFNIVVNPKPLATAPPPFDTCDTDGNNNGEFNLNLSNLEAAILTGQPNTDFSVTFYNTQADAQAGTNAIVDEAGYMAYTHTIWVRVENNITKCFRLVSFNATVEKLPEPTIFTSTGTNVICVDYNTQQVVRPLTLQVANPTPGTYTYEWFEASNPTIVIGTNPTYDITTADPTGATRTYTVKMTSVSPPQLGCSETDSFQVIQSGQAVAIGVGYEVSNAFSDMQTITVTVTGYGTYLYSLDGGPRQTSNVFENVPLGVHTITVWDDKGGVASSCDPFQLSGVQIIDYPHYFTPNGDGINDYWNIVGLDKEINAKIYIFDRQGKLIKQISPASKGWDGTYNGNLMPSTDYWFTVDYPEAGAMKQFKAHFSLKR